MPESLSFNPELHQGKEGRDVDVRVNQLRESFPLLRFSDEDDRFELEGVQSARNEVIDLSSEVGGRPIDLAPGQAVVVDKGREVGTDQMWGCACVVMRDDAKTLMAHLTPGESFAYLDDAYEPGDSSSQRYAEFTGRSLAKQAKDAGMKENAEVLVLFNAGDPKYFRKFYYKNQLAAVEVLKDGMQSEGFSAISHVELPLDETLAYLHPEQQDKVFVMGKKAEYVFTEDEQRGPSVKLAVRDETSDFWVSLSSEDSDVPSVDRSPIDEYLAAREKFLQDLNDLPDAGIDFTL